MKKIIILLISLLFITCSKSGNDDPIINPTPTDDGKPIAVNDSFNAIEDTEFVIEGLLDNDSVLDFSLIKSFDKTTVNSGSIIDNRDGTFTYNPPNGFVGTDTFTYTICDDYTPEPSCSTATVTIQVLEKITFNIPSEIQEYYENVFFTDDSDINFEQLKNHTISNHTTILSYGQRHEFLYNADADLNNSDNVILMYSGESRYWEEYTSGTNPYSPQTFNTEHIFPQSKLNSEGAVTDLHHLRACDATVNSDRLNYPFTDGSGNYQLIEETWFPGDDWKGDVARMVLYLNLRYDEDISDVGTLELFLKWNIEDPISSFEIQRNNVIYAAQGNRNPFIDNPYLATLIWWGDAAENKWQ